MNLREIDADGFRDSGKSLAMAELARPYEVVIKEYVSEECIRVTLSDDRYFVGDRIGESKVRVRHLTVVVPFKALHEENAQIVIRRAILKTKERLQEKLAQECDNKELRLWAARHLEVDLMDNSLIPNRIKVRYLRENHSVRETKQDLGKAEQDEGVAEETPRRRVTPKRVIRTRKTAVPSGDVVSDTTRERKVPRTIVGARSKTDPNVPRCNDRDHEESVNMVYLPEEGIWKCPEPGCKKIARPKNQVPIGTVVLGKGRLDIRVLFTDPSSKPSILLVSGDNVALDITEHIEDMAKFLEYSRARTYGKDAALEKKNSAEVTRKVTALLSFKTMKVQGCGNA